MRAAWCVSCAIDIDVDAVGYGASDSLSMRLNKATTMGELQEQLTGVGAIEEDLPPFATPGQSGQSNTAPQPKKRARSLLRSIVSITTSCCSAVFDCPWEPPMTKVNLQAALLRDGHRGCATCITRPQRQFKVTEGTTGPHTPGRGGPRPCAAYVKGWHIAEAED